MRKTAVLVAFTVLAHLAMPMSSYAQEGCKVVTTSCTQLNQSCEQKCQASNNQGRCIGSICAPQLSNCKASGVWKSANTAAACWKTNNRS